MKIARLTPLICACLVSVSTARANLVTNGDFENPGATLTTNYTTLSSGSLPGWTLATGNGTTPTNFYSATGSTANWIPNPQSGSYNIQLDSSTVIASYTIGNSISQTISLTANQTYQLAFWVSPEADTRDQSTNAPVGTTTRIDVFLNGGGFTNQNMNNPGTGTPGFLVTQPYYLKASPPNGSSWQEFILQFTPTSTGSVTLTFQDVWVSNLSSSNASLDNISLLAVPEFNPTILSYLCCLLAVGFHRLRQGRRR